VCSSTPKYEACVSRKGWIVIGMRLARGRLSVLLKKHRSQSITRELQDTCLRRRCVDDDQLPSLQKHSVLTKDGENQQ
jgi:hypothetical protein